MHTSPVFKEQSKVKEPGLRDRSFAQPHYSIKHIEGCDLIFYKDNKRMHSSIIDADNKDEFPGTMNIYFNRDRQEQNRVSGIP
jgi:hypothetical protein